VPDPAATGAFFREVLGAVPLAGRAAGEDGALRDEGWLVCRELSTARCVVWTRAPEINNAWGAEGWRDVDDITLQAVDRALRTRDEACRREKLTSLGVYTWERPKDFQWYYLDRFSQVQERGLALPERVSTFVVPPPSSMPRGGGAF